MTHRELPTQFNTAFYGPLKETVHTECVESRHVASSQVTNRAGPIFDVSHSESHVPIGGMLVELLINLVRERPAIYDASDPKHHDRDFIVSFWKEIS